MPTYEYECQVCSHAFEKFQSMTADRISECPECEGKVKRLIGIGGGIIFKGGGFYQTDYRSASYKAKAEKEKTNATPKKKPDASQKSTTSESKTTPPKKA